jgi:hypothetical protein
MSMKIGDRDPCELCNMQSSCHWCPFKKHKNKKLDERERNAK